MTVKRPMMCALVWLFSLGHAQASGSEYRIASVGHDHPSAEIERTTIAVQAGSDPLNRFRIVRLQAQGPALHDANPLMLLSPFGFPVEFWEITESGDYNDAFAPQVALAGHDVWLVDSRLADAEAGECESGAVDCSAMATTDHLDRFHGDVLVYAEGLGFGQMMLDTAALMTHADVTVDFHPELGESDPYFHVDRDHVALQPLLDWLEDVH